MLLGDGNGRAITYRTNHQIIRYQRDAGTDVTYNEAGAKGLMSPLVHKNASTVPLHLGPIRKLDVVNRSIRLWVKPRPKIWRRWGIRLNLYQEGTRGGTQLSKCSRIEPCGVRREQHSRERGRCYAPRLCFRRGGKAVNSTGRDNKQARRQPPGERSFSR